MLTGLAHWKQTSWWYIVPSIALYIACLPCNAFCTNGDCFLPVFMILFAGWLGVPATLANAFWIANPILFLSWIPAARHSALAMIFGLVALGIAASFTSMLGSTVAEPLHDVRITDCEIGYWLWLASIAVFCIGAFARLMMNAFFSSTR